MTDIPLAEAKARLSELIVRAAAGEPIRITKRGKPVAEINPVARTLKPFDIGAIEALTSGWPLQPESAGDFVRRMRDEDRY